MQTYWKCPFILERQIFVFEIKDSACPRGREVILILQKNVRENKTALRFELWTECNKGKKYSFLCPIFGYIVTSENTWGST